MGRADVAAAAEEEAKHSAEDLRCQLDDAKACRAGGGTSCAACSSGAGGVLHLVGLCVTRSQHMQDRLRVQSY